MTTAGGGITVEAIAARHPEWEPWLALYRHTRPAIDDDAWAEVVPAPAADAPLITGAACTIDGARAARLVRALLPEARDDAALTLIEAAINEDDTRLTALAGELRIAPALMGTIGAFAAMPLLQACARAWGGRVPPTWMSAACPVCGAWAALAEARGLERALRLRCGRCGADWAGAVLRCAFCGETDHDRLTTLVPESERETRKIEACRVCHGYVKTITTLTACAPAAVRLLDVATVELDVAALEQGYTRPETPAHRLDVRVTPRPRGLRGLLARRA